jgi:L-ribulose-5-phosphate 3-epimerase
MKPRLEIAAITDEFTPDLPAALEAMSAIGMTGAELRVIDGKNIIDLTDEELERVIARVDEKGMKIISIASPLLKCVLPGSPDVDTRFQQDVFNAKLTFEDQPRLAERAFEIAAKTGAGIIRVFSYWRTVRPEACHDAIVKALTELGERAARAGVIIGLENEHACNVGTCAETAKILAAVQHPNVKLVWDPANGLVGGESPFPEGYALLPKDRIVHVHCKDCHMEGNTPIWGPLGTRKVDWKGIVNALLADGYRGYLSLETHWPGPGGNDKMLASTICGWNMKGLAAA